MRVSDLEIEIIKQEKDNKSCSNCHISENMLSEYLEKYDEYWTNNLVLMPEESKLIFEVVNEINSIGMFIYSKSDESEDSISNFFNYKEEIELLKLEVRAEDEIVKIMFILSHNISTIIKDLTSNINSNYFHLGKDNIILKAHTAEYDSLITKLNCNWLNTRKKSQQDFKKNNKRVSPEITCLSTYNYLLTNSMKMYHFEIQEYAFINQISKEICFKMLTDLNYMYDYVIRFLKYICRYFHKLIELYNLTMKSSKDLSKIFIEEFFVFIVQNPVFKVSCLI